MDISYTYHILTIDISSMLEEILSHREVTILASPHQSCRFDLYVNKKEVRDMRCVYEYMDISYTYKILIIDISSVLVKVLNHR
jgi:hypothetical protein